ncbi:MAG TPA: carboxypeptidase regulatory-like domain-containing protein [Bryobacteraceae bacterium]|nr:carboxypeptidase regulatory-like domain-containing protein [Bryobacteraceae bacterium]
MYKQSLLRLNGFRLACLAVCLTVGWLVPHSALAQAVANAQITGQVTDETGASIAGATVKMIETEKGVSHDTITTADGRYTLPNLPVGPYRLEVSMSGFKTYVQTGVVLQVGNSPQVDVKLQVGSITENVQVVGGAAMVQSETTSVSQVINQQSIVDIPLNGRQPTQLVLLSGAAVVTPGGDMSGSKNYFSSTTISVGGGQGNGTNYLLDGGDNTDTMTNVNLPFPFPDALQEFSVDTNALPARNGTQPGGVVNIVTKSGTNSLHGDAFEFLRNGDLNARNYFAPTHDLLKRNQFGGTLGGRIIRDKLFFFGGYQGTKIRNVSPSSIAYVPTPAELAGNFSLAESAFCQSSGKPRTIHVPNGSTTITNPGNVFASGLQFDPAALALVKYLPKTGDPCGKLTYSTPSIQNEDQGVGRIDWIQNAKHTVFGRYFRTVYTAPAFFDPTNVLVTGSPGNNEGVHALTLGDTYTFTPTLLNSFHASFTRRTDYRGPDSQFFNAHALGINMTTYVPNDFRLSVSNPGFNVGCGTCSPAHLNVNTFQFADDIDWIRGKHHFGFGVDYIRTQNNLLTGYLQNGSFSFNGSGTGDSMLDFLTGTMSGFSQSLPQQPAPRMSIPALYIQDTFHASSRLTVNAGLRWQPLLWPQDVHERGAAFSMANFLNNVHSTVYPNAPAGALYYGDPGVTRSFTHDRKAVFSPRLGFAWDPSGDGKQTLRVGAGLMYDVGNMYNAQRLASDPPFVNEIDLTTSNPGGFSNPWTTGYNYGGNGTNPFPPTGAYFPQNALWILLPPNLHPTTLYQWNASYQRQLGGNILASISYLGNKSSHVYTGQELNPAVYSPQVCGQFKAGCTTGNTLQRKIFGLINPSQGQYYGNVDITDDGANANYNALLVSVQKRLSNGVTFLTNYTWSHCISDADYTGDITGPGFMNPYDLRRDRGACGFDIRHIFNASVVATSRVSGSSVWAHLLNNWQIAPVIRALSGSPLNVVSGVDASLTGINLDRPNLIPGVNPVNSNWGPGAPQYLNPAAFAINAPGTYGNLGRNALRGPGTLQFDASLVRLFNFTERFRLEARAEAFNVINHTNFIAAATGTGIPGISTSGISLSKSSANFGQITSAGDPRILQFALKLMF